MLYVNHSNVFYRMVGPVDLTDWHKYGVLPHFTLWQRVWQKLGWRYYKEPFLPLSDRYKKYAKA